MSGGTKNDKMTWLGRICAAAIFAGLLPFVPGRSAHAATDDGNFAVERSGQATCSRFLKAQAEDPQEFTRYLGFLEGYLSAANRYEPNTFDLTPWHDTHALSVILATHCKEAPEESLGIAVQRFVGAVMPLRLASHSPMVRIERNGKTAEVYEAILKRAQIALGQRALYAGPLDGKYSTALGTAFESFQKNNSLDPTGIPDVPTLWVLLNP